eukprot:gnl/TRDRNA2_/TRDRNA2_186894_c0_seq1.p1 gnl/TRDRNA2_/TRDRNA2_186894_c0~~gnl/TRDRNA2_/TRDRNA2_186894_c0_seq1.p1  ORF type:complete len:204 (+),score=43.41 gnl/TRDRNA2_/TRDRNA2_186894_c0_seq1:63-614(+)
MSAAGLVQRRHVNPVQKDTANLKILVVGDAGVGKTSLVKAFCEDKKLAKEYDPTVGADFNVRKWNMRGRDVRMNVWDVSGQQDFTDVRNEFYKESQALLLVFDVTSKKSFQNLDGWMSEADRYRNGNLNIVVAGTKVESGPRVVTEGMAKDWCAKGDFRYFDVSVAQGKNVQAVFEELVRKLL